MSNVTPLLQPTAGVRKLFSIRKRTAFVGSNAGVYFTDKQRAKKLRDEANRREGEGSTVWQVCRGPDHWRGAS